MQTLFNKKKYNRIFAIDPDCGSKPDDEGIATTGGCGLAMLFLDDGKEPDINLDTLPFYDLIAFIKSLAKGSNKEGVIVLVEASWLNGNGTTNWHIASRYSSSKNAAIGYDVGRCHEVGRKLIEACRYYGIDYEAKKPLRKIWTGKDGKITDAEIRRFMKLNKARTNQEERDAALLAWDFARLPVKIFAADKVPTNDVKRSENAQKRPKTTRKRPTWCK